MRVLQGPPSGLLGPNPTSTSHSDAISHFIEEPHMTTDNKTAADAALRVVTAYHEAWRLIQGEPLSFR